MPRLFADRG